jgi:transposase
MTLTTASLPARHPGGVAGEEPDPAARPRRRTFTAEYKLAILEEYEQLPAGAPERGALLRREGLYTSHIAEWRRQRDAAALEGLSPKTRRPKKTPEQVELERLRRRNAQLEKDLEKTRLALDITGKAHALLELLSESADTDKPSKK